MQEQIEKQYTTDDLCVTYSGQDLGIAKLCR